jgi:hypothetical protein
MPVKESRKTAIQGQRPAGRRKSWERPRFVRTEAGSAEDMTGLGGFVAFVS